MRRALLAPLAIAFIMPNTRTHTHIAEHILYAAEDPFDSIGDNLRDFLDVMVIPTANIHFLASSSNYTLTSTATKVPLTSGTLSSGYWGSQFDLYDSGSGTVDSVQYNPDDGASREFDLTASFNIKHTADDGRHLEFRALCYINDTIQNGGHVYESTSPNDNAIATGQRTTRVTLDDGDYVNYRAHYVNSVAGDGGIKAMPAVFTDSGNVNVTTSAATIPYDTATISDSNYTLNGDGSISITAAGDYRISYSSPVADDGITGNPRSALQAFVEYDVNDDGAGYVTVTQSHSQDYARETSQGEGVSTSFIANIGASSRIRARILASDTTDLSTETGKSQLSIERIPDTDGGSQSGRIEPYGTQITLLEIRTNG